MFTRYKGREIPQNYGGTAFRDISSPPTEMKTHKASPSYTSTKTSVSSAFKSAQMRYENANSALIEPYNEPSFAVPKDNYDQKNDFYQEFGNANETTEDFSKDILTEEAMNENTNQFDFDEKSKEASIEKSNDGSAKTELFGTIERILKGIRSEDFLLLCVILIIFADGKSNARGALFPLALLLLYS